MSYSFSFYRPWKLLKMLKRIQKLLKSGFVISVSFTEPSLHQLSIIASKFFLPFWSWNFPKINLNLFVMTTFQNNLWNFWITFSLKHLHEILSNRRMPDIDSLMQEWPGEVEDLLKEISLPTAALELDLPSYVDIICGMYKDAGVESVINCYFIIFHIEFIYTHLTHWIWVSHGLYVDQNPGTRHTWVAPLLDGITIY